MEPTASKLFAELMAAPSDPPGFVTASELQAARSTQPTALVSSTQPTGFVAARQPEEALSTQPTARVSSTAQPAGDASASGTHTRTSESRAEPPPVCMGTCGWSDPMKGFYPAHLRDGLEKLRFYARRFPCVEADTFTYAIPLPANVQKWAECTPPGFLFHPKLFGAFCGQDVEVGQLPCSVRALPSMGAWRERLKERAARACWLGSGSASASASASASLAHYSPRTTYYSRSASRWRGYPRMRSRRCGLATTRPSPRCRPLAGWAS